ncbi:unnamed protein product [Paramecium sonneborni]|uniref:Uncharacterized protein n=1 Tax=Paramecium sonneborni TaxID=65129 RepID=A0A8S1ML75_9CILI|nr:unnamed protein product [Paramecium sonneborni]
MHFKNQELYCQKCNEISKQIAERQQKEIQYINQKLNKIKDEIQENFKELFLFIPFKPLQIQNDEGDFQKKISEQIYQKKLDFKQSYLNCFRFEEVLNDLNNKVQGITEKLNMLLKEYEKMHPHNFIKKEWKLVDKKYQQEFCCCLTFNKNNSMLITGAGQKIKLWKFVQGQLNVTPTILTGHEKPVICLAQSMKQEIIISGSEDKTIRIWRKVGINVWTSTSHDLHQQCVMGMIFDEKMNQLISWSKENVIRISEIKKNYDLNQIQVMKGHTGSIDCVCLNEIETILCSSGNDKKLIIWMKNKNTEWQFQYVINNTNNDFICRMSFLNQKLVCLFWSEGIIQVFEQQNEKYIEKQEKIQLNKECDGENLFPCIYNKQQNILILKHNRYIYTLNDQLIQCCEPIDCKDCYCYGTLAEDGKYLAVWDDSQKMIFIYEYLQL